MFAPEIHAELFHKSSRTAVERLIAHNSIEFGVARVTATRHIGGTNLCHYVVYHPDLAVTVDLVTVSFSTGISVAAAILTGFIRRGIVPLVVTSKVEDVDLFRRFRFQALDSLLPAIAILRLVGVIGNDDKKMVDTLKSRPQIAQYVERIVERV